MACLKAWDHVSAVGVGADVALVRLAIPEPSVGCASSCPGASLCGGWLTWRGLG